MAYIKATKEDRELASRLKEIREALFGLRGGTKMAKFLNIPQPVYHKYEKAQVRLPHRIMALLARKKNVNPLWLLTGEGDKYLSREQAVGVKEAGARPKGVTIPVLESVGAADPKDINKLQPSSHILLPQQYATRDTVCLKVRDDSMEPNITNGSLVGVDCNKRLHKQLENGKVYALWTRHEGIVLRRLFRKGSTLSFVPDNPTEKNMPYIYIKKGRTYTEEPVINGHVVWVLNPLNS